MDNKDDDEFPDFNLFDAEYEEGKRLRQLGINPDADPIDIIEALAKVRDARIKAEAEGK
jgi:hypothetical protein